MTCYLPSGRVALDDTPCNPDAEASACCHRDAYCLTSKLCLDNAGGISRGSCTDSSWAENSNCSQHCQRVQPNLGSVVLPSFTYPGVGWQFSCFDRSETFTVRDLQIVLRDDDLRRVLDVRGKGESISSLAAETEDTPRQPPTQSTVSETPQSSAPFQSAALNETCSQGYSPKDMAGLGLGLTFPFLIALTGVLFLLWREKRKPKTMTMLLPDGGSSVKDMYPSRNSSIQSQAPYEIQAKDRRAELMSNNVQELYGRSFG